MSVAVMKQSRSKQVAILHLALWHWQLLAPAVFFRRMRTRHQLNRRLG